MLGYIFSSLFCVLCCTVTFEVREDAVGVGQKDSTAKFGIGESVGNSEILEDDYGIAVIPEHFTDIVTGVDPSKFAGGSGRIGDEVLRRGFGFGAVDSGDKNNTKRNAEVSRASATLSKRDSNNSIDPLTVGITFQQDDSEDGIEEMDERGLEATDLSEGRGIIRGRSGRPPIKVTALPRRLQVFAEIDYIPLEGRVDSRAARQSVRALQPRQVVVLGGPKINAIDEEGENEESKDLMPVDDVRVLADAAQAFPTTNNVVHTPSDCETVELEVGHAAYSVRLIATPYRTREVREREEEPPEPVELHEAKIGPCTVSLLDYVATGQRVALDGSIVLAPRKSSSNKPSIYLSDGDVLLTDLRAELIAQGMKAEYR